MTKQKMSIDGEDLNKTIHQAGTIIIYTTVHPVAENCTFFSRVWKIHQERSYARTIKHFNKFKRNEIT
jgi:hypothetical protein